MTAQYEQAKKKERWGNEKKHGRDSAKSQHYQETQVSVASTVEGFLSQARRMREKGKVGWGRDVRSGSSKDCGGSSSDRVSSSDVVTYTRTRAEKQAGHMHTFKHTEVEGIWELWLKVSETSILVKSAERKNLTLNAQRGGTRRLPGTFSFLNYLDISNSLSLHPHCSGCLKQQ